MNVLVVEDSAVYRKVLVELIGGFDFVHQVEGVQNARLALVKAQQLQPDVVTLDLELPDRPGLDVLAELQERSGGAKVVVISAYTEPGNARAVEALARGAVEVIHKPLLESHEQALRSLTLQLRPLLKALSLWRRAPSERAQSAERLLRKPPPPSRPLTPLPDVIPYQRPAIVVVGASTGGPNALARLLAALRAPLPVPMVVVVHMLPRFTAQFARSLASRTSLGVVEGEMGMVLRAGQVVLAPGGRHMRVGRQAGTARPRIELTDDPPLSNCKPSVDYLLHSVVDVYGARALAVILTGMGSDGTTGAAALKASGGSIFAQDAHSSVVYGMPASVVAAGVVDAQGDPEQLAALIMGAL